MSMHRTKEQLTKWIGEPHNKVIALSGRWGTGKSHLWEDVRSTSSGNPPTK